MKKLLALTIAIFIFCGQASFASNIDLYRAEILISKDANSLDSSFKTALKQVLIKVSGNPEVASVPSIVKELSNATKYVQSYRFNNVDDGHETLFVKFSVNGVNKILSESGQGMWLGYRPSLVTWVVLQSEIDPAYYQTPSSNAKLSKLLEGKAQAYGLSTILPIWDIQDLKILKPEQVWFDDFQDILKASERYQTYSEQPILIGTVTGSKVGSWQGRWILLEGRDIKSWQFKTENIEEMINHAFAKVLSYIANNNAALIENNSLTEKVHLKVSGVINSDKLTSITKFLKNISVIIDTQIAGINQDQTDFNITAIGGMPSILEAFRHASMIKSFRVDPIKNEIFINWQSNTYENQTTNTGN